MKFEVIKRSHVKRNIIIGIIVVLILSAIILTFTKAKYKITESIPLVNGTINYELSDFNLIGAYIQEGDSYTQVDEIPTSGYEFNVEKSYCTVNNENINATLNYDMETQNLTITPLTTKGTKCYLYFDEKASGSEYILASENAPTNSTTDWTNGGKGITYYYTENPNNWVQFAGFYWRIIRINGDGTIRMIYQGTSANTTGTGTQIGINIFNDSQISKVHVGLVYNTSSQHGYGLNSTILGENDSMDTTTLNGWYNTYLKDYEEYIDTGTGFCSDRNLSRGNTWNDRTLYYAATDRQSESSASLQCNSADILSKDNGRLVNPIGLLTSDEAVFNDLTYSENNNTGSYLYTGQIYWTMSPFNYSEAQTAASVFVVFSSGGLNFYEVEDYSLGVRPVINIRADVSLTGEGTSTNPFKVVGAS